MSAPHRFRSMGCEALVAGASTEEARAVEALFAERDRVFSRFRPGSELNAVNRAAGRPVAVSRLFAETVELALDVAAQTDGLVDPTLGAAILAAGYDRDFDELEPDSPEPASDEKSQGCWCEVRLDGTLLSVPAGVLLDLNGVVKARAVDDALALLSAERCFVAAGGDLAARGGATVALPGGEAVRIEDGALATSGTVRRRWRRGGLVQHHLIDPHTGRPAVAPWEQVTACGRVCVAADAFAKAGFLAGPAWLEERAVPAWFVAREPACT